MRTFAALLLFLALALAPIGSQAVAAGSAEHCAEMKPAGEHQPGQAQVKDAKCCHVVPATSPEVRGTGAQPLPASTDVVELVGFLAGRSQDAEDPPPRP